MQKTSLTPQQQLSAATLKFSTDIKKIMKKHQALLNSFQKTIDKQKALMLSQKLKKISKKLK